MTATVHTLVVLHSNIQPPLPPAISRFPNQNGKMVKDACCLEKIFKSRVHALARLSVTARWLGSRLVGGQWLNVQRQLLAFTAANWLAEWPWAEAWYTRVQIVCARWWRFEFSVGTWIAAHFYDKLSLQGLHTIHNSTLTLPHNIEAK